MRDGIPDLLDVSQAGRGLLAGIGESQRKAGQSVPGQKIRRDARKGFKKHDQSGEGL
jgi:hypothetical protein